MKYKVSAKMIRNCAANPVYIPYCGAQFLLRPYEPCAYNAGTYGWNFDVYEFPEATICTGYRNMPGRRANNYAEYDAKAKAIYDRIGYELEYDEAMRKIKELCREFLAQI